MSAYTHSFARFSRNILAALSIFAAVSLAQIDTGAIVGIVHDSSGAAVARAAITLTNNATGVVQTTASNDSGQYQFSAVLPGTYSVKASAPGFGTQVQNDIEIHVQSRPSIDFTLAVGEVSQVVDVQATDRLVGSAVVLAAEEGGPDLQMQRLLRRAGRALGPDRAVLQLNPRHPLVRRLAERADAGADLKDMAGLLLDLARVQDGDTPRDPVAFASRVAAALTAEAR